VIVIGVVGVVVVVLVILVVVVLVIMMVFMVMGMLTLPLLLLLLERPRQLHLRAAHRIAIRSRFAAKLAIGSRRNRLGCSRPVSP
jgi:hypothetical protein